MHIEVLGAESLGVRGLSCIVTLEHRKIVIDPGVALGYRRHGLLPHPAQVAVGEAIRCQIRAALREATDVVFSHYHGDHIPLPKANPYQLKAASIAAFLETPRLWAKGPQELSEHMRQRRAALVKTLERSLPNAEDRSSDGVAFSPPVPHGEPQTHLGTVMMTRIRDKETVFVHASDIQLLDETAIALILDWQPDVALVGGPPLYLSQLSSDQRSRAWHHALLLTQGIETLILDHHLLRSEEGLDWLDRLSAETGHRVICAADFMARPRCLLEARREQLYAELPVPEGWHAAYARKEAETCDYRQYVEKCVGGQPEEV